LKIYDMCTVTWWQLYNYSYMKVYVSSGDFYYLYGLFGLKLYSQLESWKIWTRSTASLPVIILNVSIRSSLIRHSCRVVSPDAVVSAHQASDEVSVPSLLLVLAPTFSKDCLSSRTQYSICDSGYTLCIWARNLWKQKFSSSYKLSYLRN